MSNELQKGDKFSGFTFDGDMFVCDKCGHRVLGIIPIAMHWNDCIDGGKTLSALKQVAEEKGNDLTVDDLQKVLP